MARPDQAQGGASRARDAMRRHDVLASGTVTGIAGGAAMLAVAMIGAASQGLAATHALQVMGHTFAGPGALDPAARIAFGALVHLVTSIGLGVLLAGLLQRDFPMASAIGVGVAFGLFALMLMMSLVVPWANPGFRGAMQDIGGTWVIAHAAYGVAVGLSPALRRRLVREPGGAAAPGAQAVLPRANAAVPTTRPT